MPIERLNSERAYDRLVQLILSGSISEEQPLSERRLADQLGFGRTPIREAIKDLVRDGVLESHPTRGTVLRPLTLSDMQDLYELRFAIEGLAAFLAAERGVVEELQGYADIFERILENPGGHDVEEVHDQGVDCHYDIVRLAGNSRMMEMYQPFRIRFRIPFGIVRKNSPDRIIEAVGEHLEIVRAIMARDADRARTLMCAHLRKGLEYRTNLLLKRSRYAMPVAGEQA